MPTGNSPGRSHADGVAPLGVPDPPFSCPDPTRGRGPPADPTTEPAVRVGADGPGDVSDDDSDS
eukprot:10606541-Prorocentrum_lima.AAC.1